MKKKYVKNFILDGFINLIILNYQIFKMFWVYVSLRKICKNKQYVLTDPNLKIPTKPYIKNYYWNNKIKSIDNI